MLFLPRTGWCSRDLSAVLNAVARFWPRACPTKQASGPALQPVSLACPPSVLLLLGTAPREVGTGLLTILGCASLSRAGTLAGGRRRGLGSLSGAGASRAPPPQLPASAPPPARSRPSAPEARAWSRQRRGGEGGDREGGAQLGAGMDAEYPAFEPPLCNGLKQLCQRLQEAYRELKEDLAPFKDDRYYR